MPFSNVKYISGELLQTSRLLRFGLIWIGLVTCRAVVNYEISLADFVQKAADHPCASFSCWPDHFGISATLKGLSIK